MNGCRWTCDGKNEMVAAMLRLCYFFYTTTFSLVLWTAHRCACVTKLLTSGSLGTSDQIDFPLPHMQAYGMVMVIHV